MTYGIGPNQREFGPYTLSRRLAIGGMSEIWLAEQKGISGFSKRVVIKTILDYMADDPELVEMFLDEGRIAAGLSHPNIAQIYDLGQIGDTYYLSMEFIHGRDLRYWLTANVGDDKLVPLGLILRIAAEVCSGLHHAHSAKDADGNPTNIIHRDISPDNILITFDGAVKIVDFGIAKASHQAKTKTGVLKGKYAYMSPEQVIGSPLDRRSDIFSLGVVMYELISGRRLFKRESEVDTLEAVSEASVPALHTLDINVPRQVEQVVLKALQRDREARFADAREMQLALEKAMMDLQQVASSADLSTFMHEMFDDEEQLDRETSAEVEKSLLEAPDVTSRASLTTPIRRKAGKDAPDPTKAEISGPRPSALDEEDHEEPRPESLLEDMAPASRPSRPASRPRPQAPPPVVLEEEDDEVEEDDEEEDTQGISQEDSIDDTVSDVPWVIDKELSEESIESLGRTEFTAERTLDEAEPRRWSFPLPAWAVIVGVIIILAGVVVTVQLIQKNRPAPKLNSDAGVSETHMTATTGPNESFRPRYSEPSSPREPEPAKKIGKPKAEAAVAPDAGTKAGTKPPKTASDQIIAANPPSEENGEDPFSLKKKRKRRKMKVAAKAKKWCRKSYEPGQGKLDVGFNGGWGVVYIDGEKIRYTPLVQHQTHAGRHGVEIRNKNGSIIRRWCVRLRKNQHVKLLHQ